MYVIKIHLKKNSHEGKLLEMSSRNRILLYLMNFFLEVRLESKYFRSDPDNLQNKFLATSSS